MLSDEFAADLLGLIPTHLPRLQNILFSACTHGMRSAITTPSSVRILNTGTNISQGSAATVLICGEIFNDQFVAGLERPKFWKTGF